LRLLHLPLHARLDGAVHVQLLDLDVEHVGDAREALHRIEDVEQLLFFLDGKLQVGAMVSVSFAGSSIFTAAIMVS